MQLTLGCTSTIDVHQNIFDNLAPCDRPQPSTESENMTTDSRICTY